MGYRIDTNRYNEEIAAVVNTNNNKIKETISSFNAQLNILGNGETWIGGSAVTNVNELVGFYNTYKDSYAQFITALSTDCRAAMDGLNNTITTNRGTALSFDDVAALSFETPNISDLSFAGGESGIADEIIRCANNFTQYAADIKNAYMSIRTAFEKIGAGSLILDTSDFGTDYATVLKNAVTSIIDSLKFADENSFKIVIENLNTAANNIKRG